MSRFLGIVGSPRHNGNTHILVNKVLEGAAQAGAEVDTLLLGDRAIRECDGCQLCWKGEHCPKADDMVEIYPRIIAANVLIFGTPVYWYGPTGLMKLFIDRFVFFNCASHRDWIAGKSAVLVVPFEETDLDTARPLVEMFEKSLAYLQMSLAARIIVPGVSARGQVSSKPEVLQEAFNVGHWLAGQRA